MISTRSFRPPVSVSRYDLAEQVGEDGTGPVFRARHRDTGAAAAVRVIVFDRDRSSLRAKLVQGFQAAARLDHPNLIRAIDLAFDSTAGYLVTEWVDGVTLADLVARDGPLTEGAAVRVVTQVAQALHYAHRRRVVHREVDPVHVLVRPDGRAKLAGFWFGKDVAGGRGSGTTPAPELPEIAPETADGPLRIGVLGDVAGLAGTLAAAVTKPRRYGPFDPPTTELTGLSPRVEAAVKQALHQDPDRRPASCLQFVRLLPAGRHWERRGPVRPVAPGRERRALARQAVTLGAACTVESDRTGGADEAWPGAVRDLSPLGVGLALARRFEPGTVLRVELDGAANGPRSLVARVANVRPEADGHWFHGCAFTQRLTPQQLAALLKAGE